MTDGPAGPTNKVFTQGPAPEPYEGTRRWEDLSIADQDRFLIACGFGDLAWNKVMADLNLKWQTAYSIYRVVYPYGTPPNSQEEGYARLRRCIERLEPSSPFGRRLHRALQRLQDVTPDGPEPAMPFGIPPPTEEDYADIDEPRADDEPRLETFKPTSRSAHGPTGSTIFGLAAAVLALIGLLPVPYGYYTLLKFAYCLVLTLLTWAALTSDGVSRYWAVLSIPLILLYNPIIPVHLGSKLIWAFVNAGTVIAIWKMTRNLEAQ